MTIPFIEYTLAPWEGFSHLTRIYAVGTAAIQLADQKWHDSAGPPLWYLGNQDIPEISFSIRENAGILCGPGLGEDASLAIRASLALCRATDKLLMPTCVLLLEEYKPCMELESISSHAALYPFVSRLFMGVADLKERAEIIREIVEDFGVANYWASPVACGKGHLVRSKETLELAERWTQEGNFDYLTLL